MENVKDFRENVCIIVALESYPLFLTLFAIWVPNGRREASSKLFPGKWLLLRITQNYTFAYMQNFYIFAEQNFTTIAACMHCDFFEMQKLQSYFIF